jgi:hypothetical protein
VAARAGACRAVVEYITWYNGTRLHSTLDYRSPADCENDHYQTTKNVAGPSYQPCPVKAGQPQYLMPGLVHLVIGP